MDFVLICNYFNITRAHNMKFFNIFCVGNLTYCSNPGKPLIKTIYPFVFPIWHYYISFQVFYSPLIVVISNNFYISIHIFTQILIIAV